MPFPGDLYGPDRVDGYTDAYQGDQCYEGYSDHGEWIQLLYKGTKYYLKWEGDLYGLLQGCVKGTKKKLSALCVVFPLRALRLKKYERLNRKGRKVFRRERKGRSLKTSDILLN